jgi:cytochrome c-type biogenesis protein CcsB
MTTEIMLMWASVTLYTIGAITFVFWAVFKLEKVVWAALWISLAGLVPHGIAIGIRWAQTGHAPYLGFYEVVSSYAFAAVVALGIIAWIRPQMRVAGIAIMPIAVLMIGGAMLAPKSPLELTPTLASYWLTIHVTFAKLSYSSFIAAFAIALVYLLRERRPEVLAKLPAQSVLDDLAFRFVAVGFIFLSVMIVAGAIWANEAWGRYWAWDPIETWSLISWIVYAAYLHTRLTLGWKGSKAAWFAVIALPVMVFTLIGVPIAYNSIHGAYLTGVKQ